MRRSRRTKLTYTLFVRSPEHICERAEYQKKFSLFLSCTSTVEHFIGREESKKKMRKERERWNNVWVERKISNLQMKRPPPFVCVCMHSSFYKFRREIRRNSDVWYYLLIYAKLPRRAMCYIFKIFSYSLREILHATCKKKGYNKVLKSQELIGANSPCNGEMQNR